MNGIGFLAVGSGAVLGAWARWLLSLWLNPLFATIPLGTLAANWIGAYLMGLVMGVFSLVPELSPQLRLLLGTGFLGGLTTFSSFSAETTSLLLRQEFSWALLAVGLHVLGSLLLTGLGLLSVHGIKVLLG
ncbi:CrcB protein [Solimonas aquatica]|uniref:Fluoride-specific ion channel FluC n=1 Tax=Solimonas aquatica TaxID=489703 RepID=A0A1H9APH5_9GAMM|nr:fluoride efflux transporter CrcB [Solimonas aquatica]SEP78367.1 CrcB protein [Solimonas aquatica]